MEIDLVELVGKDTKFWKNVAIKGEDDCWLWLGTRYTKGYGRYTKCRRSIRANRYSWTLVNGQIPAGITICHTCDNPPCVNPRHLWGGTNTQNNADRDKKGRQARGDKSGSRLHLEKRPRGDNHWSRRTPEKVSNGNNHWSIKHPEKVTRGECHGSKLHPESIIRGAAHYRHKHPELSQGDKNPAAKLTNELVLEIRQRAFQGDAANLLAREYSVSAATISYIVKRKTWTHI